MDTLTSPGGGDGGVCAHRVFSREEWARLKSSFPLSLSEGELAGLRGVNEVISLGEVADVYVPLARLLTLRAAAVHRLRLAVDAFLGTSTAQGPYIVGMAGSVAVSRRCCPAGPAGPGWTS